MIPADEPAVRAPSATARRRTASRSTSTRSARRSCPTPRPTSGCAAVLDRIERSRRRLRLGQGLGDRRQPRRAGVRLLGRPDLRPAARAVPHVPRPRDPRTFVNLDMEEYRDLELTLQSFMRVLDEPEFAGIDAGIVLQAYLPDSHDGARTPRRLGGAPTRRARRHRQGPSRQGRQPGDGAGRGRTPRLDRRRRTASKADVDASYKAMLDVALRPEWAGALRIGLASHNLFDIAWALTIGADRERARPHRVRDARGHGPGAGPRRPRGGRAAC